MKIKDFIKENIFYLDGGMGTMLEEELAFGELPERLNVTAPEKIESVHRAYFEAGCNLVLTNTFGANSLKFSETELNGIIKAAVENAKRARESSTGDQPKFIALDIGPTGKLLKPYGAFAFEEAVSVFAKTAWLGEKYGVDCIVIETMSDSYETKAALLAVKENTALPVFVSNAYGKDGKLMTGGTPAAMVALLEGMGADAIGVNCSFGPTEMQGVVEELLKKSSLPVFVKPNAGLPVVKEGKTAYDLDEETFAEKTAAFLDVGARGVGGCCGTTPAYLKKLVEKAKGKAPLPVTEKNITCVSSYTHAVEFTAPVLIGERINPTGKKRFAQALKERDTEYVLAEGLAQQEKGAHILDVNVGCPGIDEKTELPRYIESLQAVSNLPLQIDTSDPEAMEKALRLYNGKAMINSVNGKKESMERIFPLVKKYGGVVVALTLDERGIPETAEGRVEIAEKIIRKASEYGIAKKDIIVDPLAMAISADKNAAGVTLTALRMLREKLQVKTSLGVSNVSFGLPNRETVNAAFFALALENGLSAAILNPHSVEMLTTYYAFNALRGLDENCEEYIRFASCLSPLAQAQISAPQSEKSTETDGSALQKAIVKGLKEGAKEACKKLLEEKTAIEIVEGEIVPALDTVGKGYEEKRVYLPQLLMSAEASKAAFEEIKLSLLKSGKTQEKKCKVILATVHGDIHDIGKNIVGTLLENYGFEVLDLGKDVPPEKIVEETLKERAPIVGLSALMTTTLPSMEETVKRLREKAPWCKIIVGGAVLNAEYAEKIGADGYGKDGMQSVRFCQTVYEQSKK